MKALCRPSYLPTGGIPMKMTLRITPLTLLLAACGGMQAGAQPQVAKGADRLHVYEVAPGIAAQAAQQGFIEVSGTGSVSVESDLAHVSFAVETRRPSAAEAASGNATLMESVLGAIREAGLDSPRIETFGYQLRPEYTRADGNQPAEISSYVAANNIRVTLEDVTVVGQVLDIAIAAGANRVSGLSFSASNTNGAEAEALTQAVGDARRQALTIAVALGHELGAALEVYLGSRPVGSAREAGGLIQYRDSTPIEPTEQTVSSTVTVRFALGPEISRR